MSERLRYLLDANSFIRSKREHYAFDFCPAYWDAILEAWRLNRLLSIEPIRKELMRGKDVLAEWVKNDVPKEFFTAIDGTNIQAAYAKVIQWANEHSHYTRAAKQVFADSADPWLIAFAATHRDTIVTYEVSQPTSKVIVKLPDAAQQFKVACLPPYVMLRQLQVRFELAK